MKIIKSIDLETTNAVFRGMRDGLNESDLGDDYYD